MTHTTIWSVSCISKDNLDYLPLKWLINWEDKKWVLTKFLDQRLRKCLDPLIKLTLIQRIKHNSNNRSAIMFNKQISYNNINYHKFIQEDRTSSHILILKNSHIWMRFFLIQI